MKLPIPPKLLVKVNEYRTSVVFRRFTTILGVDILVKASSFILLPMYLRLMEQEEFGQYNYLISIISTFSLVLNFGFYVSQSRLYHAYDEPQKRGSVIFTINFLLTIMLSGIFLIGIIFNLDFKLIKLLFQNSFHYEEFRWILLPALAITIYSLMLTNYFYTSEKIQQVKRYNIARVLLVNGASIVALIFFSSDSVKLRLIATYLVEIVVLLFFARYVARELQFKVDKEVIGRAFKIGLPIMLSAFFGIFINFSDKFFIEKYGSRKDLSNYYLAFSFAGIIIIIYQSLQNIWLPLFLKEKELEANVRKMKKLFAKIIPIMIIIAIMIWVAFVAMLATHIIPQKYNEGIKILPVLLVTQIIAATTLLLGNYFVYFDKTYIVSVTGCVISILSVGLNLIFAPVYGLYGAIFINLIVNVVYALLYFLAVRYCIRRYRM